MTAPFHSPLGNFPQNPCNLGKVIRRPNCFKRFQPRSSPTKRKHKTWTWTKGVPQIFMVETIHYLFVCKDLHPGRLRMEPDNTPLEEEKHLPNHRFYVNLRGYKWWDISLTFVACWKLPSNCDSAGNVCSIFGSNKNHGYNLTVTWICLRWCFRILPMQLTIGSLFVFYFSNQLKVILDKHKLHQHSTLKMNLL